MGPSGPCTATIVTKATKSCVCSTIAVMISLFSASPLGLLYLWVRNCGVFDQKRIQKQCIPTSGESQDHTQYYISIKATLEGHGKSFSIVWMLLCSTQENRFSLSGHLKTNQGNDSKGTQILLFFPPPKQYIIHLAWNERCLKAWSFNTPTGLLIFLSYGDIGGEIMFIFELESM